MIISAVISVLCILAVIYEITVIYLFLRRCKVVKCRVTSSDKVQKRRQGYLAEEYYKTLTEFTYGGELRKAHLKTSAFCQTGQIISCYFHPDKNIIFRKRDLKHNLQSHSLAILSVALLFLVLNSVFGLTVLSDFLIKNIVIIFTIMLALSFTTLGIGLLIYGINSARLSSKQRVMKTSAHISDIIRKRTSGRGRAEYLYYPIYTYTFSGEKHKVTAKRALTSPPKKGGRTTILVDRKKGSLIEYHDTVTSIIQGVCFIIIAGLFIYLTLKK
ncbi:MAG: hypothetical protein IIT49_04485 [Clostridia bacterium]|nr:hypothetical protein [Clostridia bacterium]MBQ2153403.1 hypothetical protein [Clostridia bacterium]MBQ2348016.1 hypothetical protein [Clostridia bacterium]MBQ5440020.1 hypothetical protein [Clostridia bacterium]